ncbi:hypothetical protein PI126_g8583 [Phytophthora idaei]|nr:hypothetical protein PI126_g8583 [Phytophthora idaei]
MHEPRPQVVRRPAATHPIAYGPGGADGLGLGFAVAVTHGRGSDDLGGGGLVAFGNSGNTARGLATFVSGSDRVHGLARGESTTGVGGGAGHRLRVGTWYELAANGRGDEATHGLGGDAVHGPGGDAGHGLGDSVHGHSGGAGPALRVAAHGLVDAGHRLGGCVTCGLGGGDAGHRLRCDVRGGNAVDGLGGGAGQGFGGDEAHRRGDAVQGLGCGADHGLGSDASRVQGLGGNARYERNGN